MVLCVSKLSLNEHLLDEGDISGRVEPLWTRLAAVEDCVTAVKPERILQRVKPFTGGFIAAVHEPAICL